MGLFSSEYVTSVGTSVDRVIKDVSLPNALKTGVTQALLTEGELVDNMLESVIGSVGVRAERMYAYARDHYTHGLPSGTFLSASKGKPEATAILSALEGVPVEVDYCHLGPPNKLHIGWLRLIANHGYNPATNQIAAMSAIKGYPVYLDDLLVVVPTSQVATINPMVLDQWGIPATAGVTPERTLQSPALGALRAPSPIFLDATATVCYVRADCIWKVGEVLHRESLTIAVNDLDGTLDYFHVNYVVGGVVKYWLYQSGLGTWPTLDALFNQPVQTNGTFFPFGYFRYNKSSEISDTTTQTYKTSKKMLNYLGMGYDQVAAAVDANPDIAAVEQAMVVMAVPANTTHPLERRYLFEFFDILFEKTEGKFTSPVAAELAEATPREGLSALISMARDPYHARSVMVIQDKRFKMSLANTGIFKKRVMGSIGVTGSHGSGFTSGLQTVETTDLATGLVTLSQWPVQYHYYRRQVSHAIYEEIQVNGLRLMFHIYGRYMTIHNDAAASLLIPLDRSITKRYNTVDRELLYSRSLHYIFNSRVETEVKWYQQDWFQFVMMAVAIVVTMMTAFSDGGALITAIGTGSAALISAAVMTILIHLLIAVLVSVALKLFVKAFGVEFALLVALVAALWGGYKAFQAGSIQGAPWATELLALSNGLSKAINVTVADGMRDLLSEYESFNLFKTEAEKELEAANKLLEHNNFLSPWVIFGEKPNDFYNRTVHSGNIGMLSIGAISSYVDIALTLPKLDETIEGN